MRLVGMSFRTDRRPLRNGHVPLGDLSAIFGSNDSGKTSLLRLIRDELAAADTPPIPGVRRPTASVFFCQLSRAEADFLIAHLLADLVWDADDEEESEVDEARRTLDEMWRSAHGGDPLPGFRSEWPLGGWNHERFYSFAPVEPTRDAYLSVLAAVGGEDRAGQDVLLGSSRNSSTVSRGRSSHRAILAEL
jgi:hypothetical protein